MYDSAPTWSIGIYRGCNYSEMALFEALRLFRPYPIPNSEDTNTSTMSINDLQLPDDLRYIENKPPRDNHADKDIGT